MAMDGVTLRGLFLEYADACRMSGGHDAVVSAKLCEIAVAYLKGRARAFVANAAGCPLLFL